MRRGLIAFCSVLALSVVAAAPGYAVSRSEEAAGQESRVLTQFEANHKKQPFTLQQWDVPSRDSFAINIFTPFPRKLSPMVLGTDSAYVYRNRKKRKFPIAFWKQTSVSDPSQVENLLFFEDASGMTLEMPRSAARAGTYTILLEDDYYKRAQWDCSIYYQDVCNWNERVQFYGWRAFQFTMQDRTVTSFGIKSDDAFSTKKYRKQIKRLLSK